MFPYIYSCFLISLSHLMSPHVSLCLLKSFLCPHDCSCLFMCFHVSSCVFMSLNLFLSLYVSYCFFMSLFVFLCLFMSSDVFFCLFMSPLVSLCLILTFHVFSCFFMSNPQLWKASSTLLNMVTPIALSNFISSFRTLFSS